MGNAKSTPSQTNIACLYAYYEKNEAYRRNLEFFLQHGLLPHVTYYIIINGTCSATVPRQKNVTVFHRENAGFDFGAYDYVLSLVVMSSFDYVFFLNTSVRGPYLDLVPSGDWTQPFIDLLKKNADTKLVGTSINVLDSWSADWRLPYLLLGDQEKALHPHVQSMFFAVDKECLRFLRSKNTFSVGPSDTMASIIGRIEIGMSYNVLANGWNIDCVLPGYTGLDYRTMTSNPNPSSTDPYNLNTYFYTTIKPADVIFFKTNRGLPEPPMVVDTKE